MAMLLWLVCAGGCSALAVDERPAVLLQSTATQQTEIQQAVAAALNAPAVSIAADALTHSSTLVIESQSARLEGQRVQGRIPGTADRFQLLRVGSRCELLHERTGQRQVLSTARCRAIAD